MSDYTFDAVWPSPSDDVRNEVVDFWLQEIALPQGKAVERSQQLLIVCRDAAGAVAAVSTAVPSFVANLGLRCFYLRAFVGRAHRAQGLRGTGVIHRLLRESYNVLNARFQQGIDPHVVGLYLEVENSSARRHRNELVWTDLGANIVFVGTLPGGQHARLWYFDNTKIPRDR